ncbi:MAG: tyrosine-type recombinase/integrase [Ruminococcus sp.]|nr:tyrosine-type recombinase/integrase [Ruminococcus sp.]
MVKENPCKDVTLPSIKTKEREIYTLDEVQRMLELFEEESEANYKYMIFFTLAAFTGLRRGELLGLEWKDFDWDSKVPTVFSTLALNVAELHRRHSDCESHNFSFLSQYFV